MEPGIRTRLRSVGRRHAHRSLHSLYHGKMAHGIADNMLITTYLSMNAASIAPAMDLDYKYSFVQANMKTLLGYGNHIIEPEVGFLASGLEGRDVWKNLRYYLVECLDRFFDEQAQQNAKTDEAASENCKEKESDKLDLKGKKIMITAGPTYEKIDPWYVSSAIILPAKWALPLLKSAAVVVLRLRWLQCRFR